MNGKHDRPLADRPPGYGGYAPATYRRLTVHEDKTLETRLFQVAGAEGSFTAGPARFRVSVPSAKVRTRCALLLVPVGSTDILTTASSTVLGGTLLNFFAWLMTRTVSGARFGMFPTESLVGTASGPLAIPTDDRLWGFEFEVETQADEIWGELSIDGGDSLSHLAFDIWLNVGYESIEPVTEEEWRQLVQKAGIKTAENIVSAG